MVDTMTKILRAYNSLLRDATPEERNNRLTQNGLSDLKFVVNRNYPFLSDAIEQAVLDHRVAFTEELRSLEARGLPLTSGEIYFDPLLTYVEMAAQKIEPIEGQHKLPEPMIAALPKLAPPGGATRNPFRGESRNRADPKEPAGAHAFHSVQETTNHSDVDDLLEGVQIPSGNEKILSMAAEFAATSSNVSIPSEYVPHHVDLSLYNEEGDLLEHDVAAIGPSLSRTMHQTPNPNDINRACFHCSQTGHSYRDCLRYPNLTTAPRTEPPCPTCRGKHPVACRASMSLEEVKAMYARHNQNMDQGRRDNVQTGVRINANQLQAPPLGNRPRYGPGEHPMKNIMTVASQQD